MTFPSLNHNPTLPWSVNQTQLIQILQQNQEHLEESNAPQTGCVTMRGTSWSPQEVMESSSQSLLLQRPDWMKEPWQGLLLTNQMWRSCEQISWCFWDHINTHRDTDLNTDCWTEAHALHDDQLKHTGQSYSHIQASQDITKTTTSPKWAQIKNHL